MRIENPPELSQYAGDLTQAFPDALGLLVALIRLKRSLKSSLLLQSFSDFLTDLVEPWSVSLR